MIQQTTVKGPNKMLGIDIMGPLPRSPERNEYLLVVVDYYTRWVVFPLARCHSTRHSPISEERHLHKMGCTGLHLV